jgi:hypothetical protein
MNFLSFLRAVAVRPDALIASPVFERVMTPPVRVSDADPRRISRQQHWIGLSVILFSEAWACTSEGAMEASAQRYFST